MVDNSSPLNWIKYMLQPIHQVQLISQEILLEKKLKKSQFSWPFFDALKYWLLRLRRFLIHELFFIFYPSWLPKFQISNVIVFVYITLGSKFLETFPLLRVLNFFIFSIEFFIVRLSLQRSFDRSKADIPLFNDFSVFQHLLDPSFYPWFRIF